MVVHLDHGSGQTREPILPRALVSQEVFDSAQVLRLNIAWTPFPPPPFPRRHTLVLHHSSCVGQAIVQGDEGHVSGVAQGVQAHGVDGVRNEEGKKAEGEVKQEVDGEKEENNNQGRKNMCMDGMKVKRQMRSALSQNEDVKHVRRCNYRLRAVCSILQGQLVCVRRVVHVVIHNALNVSENVLVVVHNVP